MDLHIDDLLGGQGLRFFLIKSDGANVNKSATEMLTAELQNRREHLDVAILCAVHTLRNCTIWGLGDSPYESILRPAHVFESRHLKGLGDYVSAVLRPGIDLDSLLDGATDQECARAVGDQDALSPVVSDLPTVGAERADTKRAPDELKAPRAPTSAAEKIWDRLLPLIIGERGPFQIAGPKSRSKEAAHLCAQLWPCGVPNIFGDGRNCAPGFTKSDYVGALRLIFGQSLPITISSRRYELFLRPNTTYRLFSATYHSALLKGCVNSDSGN